MIIRVEKHKQVLKTEVYFCKCDICGSEYQSKEGDVLCSSECRRKAAIKRSTQRRKERRSKDKAKLPDTICAHCSKPFRPIRNDAKYCSTTCKQAQYRDRKNKSIKKKTDNVRDIRLTRIRKIFAEIKRMPNPYRAYQLVNELRELKNKRFPLSSRAIEILTREHKKSHSNETLENEITDMRNSMNRLFKLLIEEAIEGTGGESASRQKYFVPDTNLLDARSRLHRDRLIKSVLVFIGKDGLDLVYSSFSTDSETYVKAPMSGYHI